MDHVILQIGLALALVASAIVLAHRLGVSNVPFLILIVVASFMLGGREQVEAAEGEIVAEGEESRA